MNRPIKTPGAGGRRGLESARATALAQLYQGDPRLDFIDAIRTAGINIAETDCISADGAIHRFDVEGDHRGRRNGWCVLFADPNGSFGGAFGSWKLGITGTWRSGRGQMTAVERARLCDAIAEARQRQARVRADGQHAAQQRAVALWERSNDADPKHAYLLRKRVNPWGVRQSGDALLVPMRDADGTLWSLQFIRPDGSKRFLAGGRTAGLFHMLGAPPTTRVAIAEGYATGAAVYEAHRYELPVASAFSCGNLRRVACAIRMRNPFAEIIIAGDNDPPGIAAAHEAARAVNGRAAFPPEPYNDFDDMAVAGALA